MMSQNLILYVRSTIVSNLLFYRFFRALLPLQTCLLLLAAGFSVPASAQEITTPCEMPAKPTVQPVIRAGEESELESLKRLEVITLAYIKLSDAYLLCLDNQLQAESEDMSFELKKFLITLYNASIDDQNSIAEDFNQLTTPYTNSRKTRSDTESSVLTVP